MAQNRRQTSGRWLDYLVSSSDTEILRVLLHELVLELVVGGNVHHAIHKQSMDNEMLTLAFHENSLLAIYREVAIRLHPCRDVLVPSACSLSGTMDALEQLQTMTFGYRLWPPVRSSYTRTSFIE